MKNIEKKTVKKTRDKLYKITLGIWVKFRSEIKAFAKKHHLNIVHDGPTIDGTPVLTVDGKSGEAFRMFPLTDEERDTYNKPHGLVFVRSAYRCNDEWTIDLNSKGKVIGYRKVCDNVKEALLCSDVDTTLDMLRNPHDMLVTVTWKKIRKDLRKFAKDNSLTILEDNRDALRIEHKSARSNVLKENAHLVLGPHRTTLKYYDENPDAVASYTFDYGEEHYLKKDKNGKVVGYDKFLKEIKETLLTAHNEPDNDHYEENCHPFNVMGGFGMGVGYCHPADMFNCPGFKEAVRTIVKDTLADLVNR